jgi:C-terminal processing protease CtpA/Prc
MLFDKAVTLLFSLIIATTCALSLANAEPRQAASDAPSLALPRFDQDCPQLLEMRYHTVWRLLADNTMFPERLSKWGEWEHKFDGKLTDQRSTETAINQLIAALKDEYTYFRDAAATRARELEFDQRGVIAYKHLSGQVSYLQIKTFSSKHTAEEMEQALLSTASASAYIIDLRGNRGGCVDEAYKIFAMFVDKGRFALMRGRAAGDPYLEDLQVTTSKLRSTVNGVTTSTARIGNLTGKKPVLILVDNNTRSASEMLAGALKDNRRAKLLGSSTYGKGVIQNTWLFDDGTSIKIAMAKYYLPELGCINGVGITPNYTVPVQPGRDAQLAEAVRLVQHSLAYQTK